MFQGVRGVVWLAAVLVWIMPASALAQVNVPTAVSVVVPPSQEGSTVQAGQPARIFTSGEGVLASQGTQPAQAAPPTLPRIRLGALAYLSLQAGDAVAVDSIFLVKRSYINVEADILPYLSARVTPDVYADDDGIELRLKYAYAEFRGGGNSIVTRPIVRVGMVPTPWFMFEEQVNRYRMQDAMFIERSGVLDSADTGITASGLLGGLLPDEARLAAGNHDAGRYGSFAFGVYNGGGYTTRELNSNKVFQARLTLRPLPAVVPGLQASYFLVRGEGNTVASPDWSDNLLMVSWEHARATATAQWVDGSGNQAGTRADPVTAEAWPHKGWSVFGEGRLSDKWSVIARFDDFNADTRTDEDHFRRVITGLAYTLSGNNRVLADVDHRDWTSPEKTDETRYQITLQISF